jgi:hypothetical protein
MVIELAGIAAARLTAAPANGWQRSPKTNGARRASATGYLHAANQ